MDQGPVGQPAGEPGPSWRLTSPDDAKTQGIVVSGFSDLPWCKALFLCAGPRAGWLTTLRTLAPITDAAGKAGQQRAAAMAFTCSGLKMLGVHPDVLKTFAAPFSEGMFQEDRLRRLGDKLEGRWLETVIPGGPVWSGNRLPQPPDTPTTVHALLMLYSASEQDANDWDDEITRALEPLGVTVPRRHLLDLRFENGIAREHFGFADGVSQPIPHGESVILKNATAATMRWHGVPLGEILLGHTNVHHEKAPGPLIPDDNLPHPGLESEGVAEGFLDLGRNGSYMVVRELKQNVWAFWDSMTKAAAKIQERDPNTPHVSAQWLAERIIGRTLDGHMLCPAGAMPPGPDGLATNDFGFFQNDQFGTGCPMGSHTRRGNPRDGLAPDAASTDTLLEAANNHRILRRGRKYGTTLEDPRIDDGQERGLLFICLNTDIARQFEFVQQTWILNTNFATLFDESDPLVGPKGHFTIPETPLRRIVEVETFVQMVGGEYFFLPSIPALDYLTALG